MDKLLNTISLSLFFAQTHHDADIDAIAQSLVDAIEGLGYHKLPGWEIVHHKGIRYKDIRNGSDNLEDNLQLVTDERHKQITILEKRIAYLEKRITLLEAENACLQIKVV